MKPPLRCDELLLQSIAYAGSAADVGAMSRRVTSSNATGIAAMPIAPQTQNAHWKPPVRAAGPDAPEWTSVLKCVAATVEATATPIAAPICCEVLSNPEASPDSLSATPASAAIETGMKAKAVPAPATKNGAARSAQNRPCTGAAVVQRMPPPIRLMPQAITSFAEMRVTSACDRPARATEVMEATSQASPVSSAE